MSRRRTRQDDSRFDWVAVVMVTLLVSPVFRRKWSFHADQLFRSQIQSVSFLRRRPDPADQRG
jgi:hypothetical protein